MKLFLVFRDGFPAGQILVPERELTIGADPENDLRLEARGVSGRHVSVRAVPGGVVMKDLGSKHGIVHDGAVVRQATLSHGDRAALGSVVLQVHDGDVSDLPAPGQVPDHTFRFCLREFMDALECDAGYLMSETGHGLAEMAGEGSLDRAVLSRTLLERAASSEDAFVVEDPSRHPSLAEAASLAGETAPWSIHYIPLRCAGRLIGMVCLSRRKAPPGAAAADGERVRSLTRLAGVLLHMHQLSTSLQEQQIQVMRSREEIDRRLMEELGAGDLLGESEAFRRVVMECDRVAGAGYPVLLLGESGTGKELLARRIHRLSGRTGLFIPLDCASIPRELVATELFGHEKGAFTGAGAPRKGHFEMAHGGTLFLDELAELDTSGQASLLRVLGGERQEFMRVGSSTVREADVRVIAATSRDLQRMVEKGSFKEELYYRLSFLTIRIPPLRERPGDIPRLAMAFVRNEARGLHKRIDGFSVEALQAFNSHPWKGNVRELKAAVCHAVVYARSGTVGVEDLPAEIAGRREGAVLAVPGSILEKDLKSALREFERAYLRSHLERAGGNVAEVARRAGRLRESLSRRFKTLGLEPDDYRSPRGGTSSRRAGGPARDR